MMTWDDTFMSIANTVALRSKGNRLKVGAVLVRDNRILSFGYNGLPSGYEPDILEDDKGVTKPDVIHAELNCILNAAKEGISLKDSILYVTHSPCRHCAALIKQSGITKVVFGNYYRDTQGLDKLTEYKIQHIKYETT